VTPARSGTLFGNRITALRWARILRNLGHQAVILEAWANERCDALVALHAKRSAPSALKFAALFPDRPLIVALTGTDVYRDIHRSRRAQQALALAWRIISLQPLAAFELAPGLRHKVRVIYQSASPTKPAPNRPKHFRVCVIGHLRPVKDPFRTAMAVRRVPGPSRIEVVHAGAAMNKSMARRAQAEQLHNHRYRWLGAISQARVRRLIASSHLLVLSSKLEGGANVISEALVDGTPVLASRIPGSVGLLAADYPGYFEVGDTRALQVLLQKAEADKRFYRELVSRCRVSAKQFTVAGEKRRWKTLLSELNM